MTEEAYEKGGDDRRAEQPSSLEDSPLASTEYMELYKLAVEMTDRMSARRGNTNAFFVTVNTALLAFLGVAELGVVWPVATAGVVVSCTWALLIKSYRDLNAAKFTVINTAEQRLPLKIYYDEWQIVKAEHPRKLRNFLKRYLEFTVVEIFIPLVFLLLYLAILFL